MSTERDPHHFETRPREDGAAAARWRTRRIGDVDSHLRVDDAGLTHVAAGEDVEHVPWGRINRVKIFAPRAPRLHAAASWAGALVGLDFVDPPTLTVQLFSDDLDPLPHTAWEVFQSQRSPVPRREAERLGRDLGEAAWDPFARERLLEGIG